MRYCTEATGVDIRNGDQTSIDLPQLVEVSSFEVVSMPNLESLSAGVLRTASYIEVRSNPKLAAFNAPMLNVTNPERNMFVDNGYCNEGAGR